MYMIFIFSLLISLAIARDTPDALLGRQLIATCDLGDKVCGSVCIDTTWTCCPDELGGCPLTEICSLGSNNEYGCCPTGGAICIGPGGAPTGLSGPASPTTHPVAAGADDSYRATSLFRNIGAVFAALFLL